VFHIILVHLQQGLEAGVVGGGTLREAPSVRSILHLYSQFNGAPPRPFLELKLENA